MATYTFKDNHFKLESVSSISIFPEFLPDMLNRVYISMPSFVDGLEVAPEDKPEYLAFVEAWKDANK